MPPGEPVASNSEKDEDVFSEPKEKRYQPCFKKSDPFVEPLLNFDADTSKMEEVYSAVSHWTQIALDLKAKGYPIAEGINNWKKFDAKTREDARMLDDFLNLFISKNLYAQDKPYEVLRVLIAQGTPYLEFKEKMSRVDFSIKCNTIWENDAVAYRCNTCALTPCMSLCESCFDANGHAGHDYTRFFSREGGACDCGNQDVIREQGNCPEHGDESKRPKYEMNDVCIAEYIVMKLLVRLFLDYRGWISRYKTQEQAYIAANRHEDRPHVFDLGLFTEADAALGNKLIDFLQECANYGGPMRTIVAEVLLNKELYRALTEKTGEHYDASGRVELNLDWRTAHIFMDDRESVLLPGGDDSCDFPLVDSLESTECHSLLDELIFWINRQLFPQNLVNFGLGMLSEPGYRDDFAYRFFAWYPICGKVIKDLCVSQADHARVEDRVSPSCSRAVHVTVQMLSSASLCKDLNEKVQLVKTIFDVTRFLICERLVESEQCLMANNLFVVRASQLDYPIDARVWNVMTMRENAAISQHGYWFVMGDIQNVLTHPDLAVESVLDDHCFGGSYMQMMCQMQGMNTIWRVIGGNALEMDGGEEVQRAYTLEFETLAVTLFNVVAAIQQENSITGAQRFFDHVRAKLEKWFQYLSPISTCPPEDREEVWEQLHRAQAYAVTFHIPLHRHLSTALTHFTELDGFYDYIKQHLLDDEIFVRIIIIHPLRIQVARTEINCGMWVRNGAQARMSALIYSQWNVSSAFQTPDVDLIRFCGAHIDKEHFAMLLATGFNVTEKVRFERAQLHGRIRHKHVLFNGCGRKSWKEEEDVTEEEIAEFHEFRNLIREKPKMVEEMIVNLDGEIAEGASFNKEDRTKFRLRLNQYNISKIVIEFGVVIMDAPTTSVMARIMARIARHQPINETSSDEEDEGDEEERREEHRDSPPNIEAPRRIIMARQFENEDAPRIPVLREPEWIDPMFWGMFKLVAEIIVVRVNSGATSEQHYRQEMVNCMAMGNVSYSRLRASIAEKGSRGSELIDKHFEAILKEIGDFVTPNEASNYLQQGTYRLKTSVWDSELCPVFFMMRSTSMKQAREVFSKMEARERKNLVDKEEDNGGVKMETNFWVPFRIIDFSETRRHQGIAQIYNLLLTERFLLNCLAVLATGPNSLAKFHEATMQLAVYLLTLGVKYAEQYKGTKEVKEYLRTIYHTPYQVTKETGNSSTYHTICSFMINLVETDARDKDSLVPLFKNILNGVYDREKIAGGRMIYLARFVTILCKLSPTCRQIIESKLAVEEIEIGKLAIKEESKKALDPAKAAAKAAAKSRMAAIMQKSAQKSAMTMQKLMASEGMSAAEVDKVDPSQQNRKVYQCPICGDQETPNTVEQPFGMLAKLSTNFVCEEQIDASCSPLQEILDFDRQANTDGLKAQLETRRNYADKRRMASVENPQPEVAKVRAPMVGTDLKTCGHAAHIACFNAYRASLYDGRHRPVDRREVGCPMCRYTVNTIVPISFDKPYTPIKTPPSPLSDPDVWKTMNLVLRKARGPVFQEDEKNVRYATLYSTRDGGGLCELWTGRQHSADWTERQSSYEKCTVSTLLVSMAVAMVERASLLRGMGVPERRKNARNSLTVHLMTASVATSKDVDFDVTLSALTSLLAKVSTHPPPPPPSSTVPPTLLSAESTPEPSTSREPTPTIEISVPGLTTDEMASLTTKTSRKRPIEGESEIRMKVPLFVLEPKSTLVRMLAILIDNVSISKEIQREIAHTIIKAITGWVSAYTTLCLVLRLGDHKIMQLKNGELKIEGLSRHQHDVVEAIAKALCSNMSFFEFMVQKLASPDVELDDAEFGKTIATATVNFLRFAAELLLHCDLGTVDTVECIQGPEITMEMVMSRMNIDANFTHVVDQANYWTMMYKQNLGWMSTLTKFFQPCIYEPLTWKPRRILRPPKSFEELFTRYFHRECLNCSTSPANPVVCLMCGQLLCLDDCCRVTHQEVGSDRVLSMSEVEAHAERCSSSSGLFISITSSMILVMRGKQATIWGTVYLDAHKEEDRNLRRGKPLFLCESRLKWLEYDWAEQEWQRVYQWFNLSNSHAFINHIRDCHLIPHFV